MKPAPLTPQLVCRVRPVMEQALWAVGEPRGRNPSVVSWGHCLHGVLGAGDTRRLEVSGYLMGAGPDHTTVAWSPCGSDPCPSPP